MYQGFKEDPFIYFGSDEPIFKEISEYYGLQQELKSQMFLTRCKDLTKKNTLYYTTEIVRDIVQSNEDKVKIINTGVKVPIEIILLQYHLNDKFYTLHLQQDYISFRLLHVVRTKGQCATSGNTYLRI